MKNKSKIYKRNCPSCGNEITYTFQSGLSAANKKKSFCNSCANSGISNPMFGNGYKISGEKNGWYGKKHSEVIRKKHSEYLSQKYIGDGNPFYGKTHTDEIKSKLSKLSKDREILAEWILKSRLGIIKYRKEHGLADFVPNYNPSSIPILEQKAKELGITDLQHAENGGEFCIKELGYWVDGYSKEKNIIIEYYENRHSKKIEKDLQRQKEITNLLKCEFIIIYEK
jgi:hypothetical protein